jgi:ferredoxin-NADP reductase/predicted pyridoxine 5'-phosphate oxidase superfamily flavin-nucleotide-binding protein
MQATPFHSGERAIQEKLGVRQQIETFASRVVRPFLPEQHREFYQNLPFLVAAARDPSGRPWATVLAGTPGFVATPDARSIDIAARPASGDALAGSFGAGADVGLLGIEFATRRRNRVNGRIAHTTGKGVQISVDQSFGNCPQHIHVRDWASAPAQRAPEVQRFDCIPEALTTWIERADTFFIATGHRADGEAAFYGMDASHRGGAPGFVSLTDRRTLSFPDYAGNNHFNTIGNLLLDSRIGLLFVDFEAGHLMQLTGRANIDWDSPRVTAVPGARRLVSVAIEEVVVQKDVLPLRWQKPRAEAISLRVERKEPESRDVTSFILKADDGARLEEFKPGQHLPVEIKLPGTEHPLTRTYSLSGAPDSGFYRLTIKRETHGLVSRFLHDEIEQGARLSVQPPAGDFMLAPGNRPVVLLSAGVGVTPMVSMLATLAGAHETRKAWFIHGARDGEHYPLAHEIREYAEQTDRIHLLTAFSRPRGADVKGRDFDHQGRIDGELLSSRLPSVDADFYLCGPLSFMAELQSLLVTRGVPAARIKTESFG